MEERGADKQARMSDDDGKEWMRSWMKKKRKSRTKARGQVGNKKVRRDRPTNGRCYLEVEIPRGRRREVSGEAARPFN